MPPTQQRQPEAKPDAGKRKKKAVSKDSGSYGNKDGMQPYTQLLHSVADYRRKWRTLVLLLVVLGLFFVALGVSLPWDTVSTSETYDPSVGLSLSLAGCDARLVSGSTATVTYHARRGVAPVTWVRPFAESSTVSEAHAHNTEWDCADAPLGLCSSWCRLTVEVPPGASSAAIQLLQPSGDASHPSVTIGNVTVGSITTAPANTPLPSLSLHLVHTTVLGATTIRLHEGGVHSVGSSLRGETRLVVSGGGSVRVHEVAAHERSLSVRYAQPQGLACFATDQPRAAISASWPWDECPVAQQAPSLAAQLRARYDMDGDGKVSLAEFTGAAEALSCCGPHAPLSCSCTPEASALGLSATAVVTNGGLPLANFEDAIKNYNASGLVSYGSSHAGGATCLEGVTLAAGYSTPLATANLLELSSAHGEVSVTARQAPLWESGPGGAWTGLIAPDSSLRPSRGPKLALPDAIRVRRRFGGLGRAHTKGSSSSSESSSAATSGPVYIIFDVLSSVGKPWRRWVYSSSDAYLAIDPAHLALLSGYSIGPTIHRERVRVVNDDCSLLSPPAAIGSAASSTAYALATDEARRAIARTVDLATYAQLRALLVDAPTAALGEAAELRGSLVMIPDLDEGDLPAAVSAASSSSASSASSSSASSASSTSSVFSASGERVWTNWLFQTPRYISFEPRAHGAPGARLRLDWLASSTAHAHTIGAVYAAAALALVAGFAAGLFGLYVFWKWTLRIRNDAQATTSARARAVLARHDLPEPEIRWLLANLDASPRLSAEAAAHRPLTALLFAFDHLAFALSEVMVAPLRRRLISSVGAFVHEKLRQAPAVHKRGDGSGGGGGGGGGVAGDADAYYASVRAKPIEMRELIQKYELFCVAHGYVIDENNDDISAYLTGLPHVHVHQSFVRRIFGLRWKNSRDPLHPDAKEVVREKEMPAELRWSALYAPMGGDPEARAKAVAEEEAAAAKRSAARKGRGGGEGAENFPPSAVPVEYGGKQGFGSKPPIAPLAPLAPPLAPHPFSTQWQQQQQQARAAPPLPQGAPDGAGTGAAVPPAASSAPNMSDQRPLSADNAPLKARPPRKYMYDSRGQLVYDEYGSPVYADETAGDTGAPPRTPPASPPASPPSQRYAVVPPAHGSYPLHACAAGASRAGCALVASHMAALRNASSSGGSGPPPLSRDAGPMQPDPLPAEWWVLRRFVRETCHEEPGGLNAFIDVEDTFDPSVGASSTGAGAAGQGARGGEGGAAGPIARGFRLPLYEWCRARQRGLPLPALQGSYWANALPEGVNFRDQLRVRQVLGLEWLPGWRRQQSKGWLLAEAIDVCLHVIALVVVPSALCYYALDAQRAWAKLLCVPSVSDDILEPAAAASVAATNGSAVAFSNTFGRGLSRVGPGDCSWWADFAPLPPKLNLLGGSSPLPIVAFVVCDTILFALASFIRLLLTYLGVETCSINDASAAATLPRIASLFYGALLLLNLVLLFAAVGMILAWHVLGGATQPLAFLPDYAIVLSVIVLTQAVGSSMFRAARSLHDGLLRAFLHTLQPHLQAAYHRAQFQLSLQRAAAVGKHLARPSEYIDSAEAHAAAEEMHNLRAEIEAAERQALLTGDTPVLAPPQAYVHGRMADETRGRTGGYAGGYAAGRILQPVDIYLVLAGDGRRPLLVEEFRPRFETLGLPLTTRQKEVLYSQIEKADEKVREEEELQRSTNHRRGASKTAPSDGDEVSRIVTASQFGEAWEAMEQGLLRRGLRKGGVSAAQTAAAVGLCLTAHGIFLAFLAVGFRRADGFGSDRDASDAFVSVVRAVLVLACALFVVVARPRARGEKDPAAVVEEVIADDLADANEA